MSFDLPAVEKSANFLAAGLNVFLQKSLVLLWKTLLRIGFRFTESFVDFSLVHDMRKRSSPSKTGIC